jgi:cell division protein FtsX
VSELSQPEPGPQIPPLDAPADGTAQRPRRLMTTILIVAALLIGSAATFSGLLIAGWRQQPEQHYTVLVFFKADVPAEQREAVRVALARIPAKNGVQLETSQQAYDRFKEEFKDQPQLLEGVTADKMPQSFHVETISRNDFDCTLLDPLRTMPGIDQYGVAQSPRDGHPGAKIAC